jgi:hypothetical protein
LELIEEEEERVQKLWSLKQIGRGGGLRRAGWFSDVCEETQFRAIENPNSKTLFLNQERLSTATTRASGNEEVLCRRRRVLRDYSYRSIRLSISRSKLLLSEAEGKRWIQNPVCSEASVVRGERERCR